MPLFCLIMTDLLLSKDMTDDDPPNDQSNRDNPALARQTKKTKSN